MEKRQRRVLLLVALSFWQSSLPTLPVCARTARRRLTTERSESVSEEAAYPLFLHLLLTHFTVRWLSFCCYIISGCRGIALTDGDCDSRVCAVLQLHILSRRCRIFSVTCGTGYVLLNRRGRRSHKTPGHAGVSHPRNQLCARSTLPFLRCARNLQHRACTNFSGQDVCL